MSQDIVTVRRQAKQVSSLLRQGNMVSAVQSLMAALRLMMTTPLMKAERDEFEDVISEGLGYLNNDKELRKIYPLEIAYVSGEEKKLTDELRELLETLNEDTMNGVAKMAAAVAAKKKAALDEGQECLDAKEFDAARSVFGNISSEFPDDGELRSAIGEKALAAGLYEDAAEHLSAAVTIDPQSLRLYNRLAIALRKLGRFEMAERYYMTALPMAPADPSLLFNVGRLYAEWGKWDKALEFGEKALVAQPDFEEARKLAVFARNKAAAP